MQTSNAHLNAILPEHELGQPVEEQSAPIHPFMHSHVPSMHSPCAEHCKCERTKISFDYLFFFQNIVNPIKPKKKGEKKTFEDLLRLDTFFDHNWYHPISRLNHKSIVFQHTHRAHYTRRV
jgi:hypothetical protein